jgi:pyruvate,water dikinase
MKPLDRITFDDATRVGAKAYNCARLRQAGFPVPDGFALTADSEGPPVASSELQDWLSRLPHDALLAVRSSAAGEDSAGHSFAGIHRTILNVPLHAVPEAVDACWASVHSPQANAYRRTQGLPSDNLKVGVLIQKMIQPVVSGVAFTVNPVTYASDELILSAAWGLGDAVVGGHVEPDEFRVRRSDGAVLSSHIGSKRYYVEWEEGASRLVENRPDRCASPSLSDKQIQELAVMLVQIEEHFGSPQDVEWCHDGEQFWILQSRPVTARAAGPGPDIEWTRANTREVLPDLASPQALDFACKLLNRAMRDFYGRLLAPDHKLGPVAGVFYGRLYFNLSQFRHICAVVGSPAATLLRAVGHPEEIKPEDEIAARPPLGQLVRVMPDLLRIGWLQARARRLMHRHVAFRQEAVRQLAARDPHKLSDAEIWPVIKEWVDEGPEVIKTVLVFGTVSLYEQRLQKLCKRVGFSYEQLAHSQLAVGEKSVSAQQAFDLLTLANLARCEGAARDYFASQENPFETLREALAGTEFLKQFDLFIEKYGHRGSYESDWSLPRYNEDPTSLLATIRAHVLAPDCRGPEVIISRQEREAADTWKAFEASLSKLQRLVLIPQVRWLLRRMKQMYVWRENFRSEIVRGVSALRTWNGTLAQRLASRGWIEQPDDYFFLTFEEIGAAVLDPSTPADLSRIVAERKADQDVWRHLKMPLLMHESQLPALLRQATGELPETDAGQLRGVCVSAGCVEGEVVVINDPTDFARMKHGAILVAPATDPSWTPMFTLASGVIVEVGGTLSHSSTIAREYGLPALANLKNATRFLKDGDRVRLDATSGVVHLIGRAGGRDANEPDRQE